LKNVKAADGQAAKVAPAPAASANEKVCFVQCDHYCEHASKVQT
jgi:hypothetical protein